MSTPGEEPRYATGYGGARYPLPPQGEQGAAPAPGQGGGGYPYAQYSPYGPYTPPPAGLPSSGLEKPARPGIMVLGLVLLALAALPFLAFGLLFLVAPLGPEVLPPDILDNPQLRDAGVTDIGLLISAVRLMSGILAGLAAVYLLFAVLAFTGRNWARMLVAVMTAGFSLFLILGVTSAVAADPLGAVLLLVPVVLSVAGLATWFAPQANRWYAAR
jgi:hypothetical protein